MIPNMWIPVVANIFVSLACAIFVYGRLTERTKNHIEATEKKFDEVDGELSLQRGQITNHENRLSTVEGSLGRGVSAGRR